MASKRARRRHACEGKRPYPSQAEAVRSAHSLRSEGVEGIGTYRCPWCRQWHVGHMPRRVLQAMAARREAVGQ